MKKRNSRYIFACGVSAIAILASAPVYAQSDNASELSAGEATDGNTVVVVTARRKALETATDKCEDAANVIESIIIKYA